MLTKNKSIILKLILVIVILLYFIYANQIVAYLTSSNKIERTNFDDLRTTQKGTYDFGWEYLGDAFEQIIFKGWAFCETTKGNEGKSISVVLKSDQGSYIITGDALWAPDVNLAFSKEYEISGQKHRYELRSSTAALPNGLYDIYLYCRENADDTMLVNVYTRLRKDGARLEETNASEQTDIVQASVSEKMKMFVDPFEFQDGRLIGTGWGFLEGKNTEYQNVFLNIRANNKITTYWLKPHPRNDVKKFFKNDLYVNSGFDIDIPLNEISSDEIELEFVISLGGQYYTTGDSKKYSIVNNEVKRTK